MYHLKELLKPIAWVFFALGGFIYDWFRFTKHAGARYTPSPSRLQYVVIKIYHRLEKSLALPGRRPGHGKAAVYALTKVLRQRIRPGSNLHFQERVALRVLHEFIELEKPHVDYSKEQKLLAVTNANFQDEPGGALNLPRAHLQKGMLGDPQVFFGTRHSVRDFKPQPVSSEDLRLALELASTTPSVCNRQAWHVYYTEDRTVIDKALSFQNGNQGFGHRIPTLLVLAADLNAFDTSAERYQHWIDGGMYSMTLVWALHSLGLGSCCLNWSKDVLDDIKFRKALNVKKNHSVLMLLAVGHMQDNVAVCVSARTPIQEKITELKVR